MSSSDKLIHEQKLKTLYHKIGLKHNISQKELKELINSPYEFSQQTIKNLKLKDIEEEEFDKLKTNFIYKYLGKFYVEFKRILYDRKKKELGFKRSKQDN